jgi:hypothetical protein
MLRVLQKDYATGIVLQLSILSTESVDYVQIFSPQIPLISADF